MPAIVNWFLRLLPTNPICLRLIFGGSKRVRHLYIRSAYLAVIMAVLLFVLLGEIGGGTLSVRKLASGGATMFQWVSYMQVGLICLLTPVFMAGAIAQEANPKTWDILLTTPLNNLQIVLGNLFGRLFFVLALLFSSLPLFVMTQYFGGVPGNSIFSSYAIAGTSSLLVAAIAVTLSVTRTAGRRAVFVFYVAVVMYLFATYALDLFLRQANPVGAAGTAFYTTIITPLNPFLALEVLLQSNAYVPRDLTGLGAGWLTRAWLSDPISTFCWLCALLSLILVLYSTLRLRVIGAKTGSISLVRRMFKLGARGATEREPRRVGHNPIAWRESAGRNRTLATLLGRWSFVALGVIVVLVLIGLHHNGTLTPQQLRLAVASVVSAELVIITLVAINMSATAVAREREDGTLDLILTTPIQPGPYIAGKLRGLIQYLLPLMLVPTLTMLILAVYVLGGGFGSSSAVRVDDGVASAGVTFNSMPIVLPEGALSLPIMFVPFIAFCVMIGLHWSIRSKGTIGSVIAAVAIVLGTAGVLSLCALAGGQSISVIGGALASFSPINLLFSMVYPARMIPDALGQGTSANIVAGRTSVVVGAVIAAVVYGALVYGMHANMKRTFMMTVRKLTGTS